MEAVRLFILKIILSSIVLNIAMASINKDSKQNKNLQTTITNNRSAPTINLEKTGINKTKPPRMARNAQRRNWSKSSLGGYNNMPPYLVFNRKTGSYYPYYSYPKENSVRRSGGNSKKWSH